MSKKRKSFIVHNDSLDVLDDLTNEQAGMLFKAIKSYQLGDDFELDTLTKIAFSPFKNQFERDYVKYENLCEKNRLIAESRYSTKSTTGKSGNQSLPKATKSTDNDSKNKSDSDSKDLLCEEAFSIFYSAGLVKKSKVKALSLFKSLVKQMECDPLEFAELLKSDVQYRINNNQFGINKLHPSTYLNQQRWTDEHDSEKDDFRYTQGNGKKSAAERIRERNEREYGSQQSGGSMGVAADGGDIRGAVGEGTRGKAIIDMEGGS